jgi:2,4-dienoyl-CoA reductase-like NADH-dependent reductase (Old Yellow Enzyme family)
MIGRPHIRFREPSVTTAYDPIDLSGTPLANRIAMAPMTRSRAGEGGTPTDLTVEYYAQRASAGLIITEGIQPSATARATRTPRACTAPSRSPPGGR